MFNWSEADRVVLASKAASVKIIARLDFQPDWARADRAHNGPPDNYEDFGRLVTALAKRYGSNSLRWAGPGHPGLERAKPRP